MYFIKVLVAIALALWVLSIVVTPFTLPPGTIILGEAGRANYIDYPEIWTKLPLPQRIVYALGDLICHQKTSRSFIINGNQMPVCSRDLGLYSGALIAYLYLYILEKKKPLTYRRLINTFFKKEKKLFTALYIALVLPLLIDFTLQYTTSWSSNNYIRLGTGMAFGYANMILFYYLVFEL
ncbi:MAG: DUF2085 domain-containing protein [Thermoprotei archaeon]